VEKIIFYRHNFINRAVVDSMHMMNNKVAPVTATTTSRPTSLIQITQSTQSAFTNPIMITIHRVLSLSRGSTLRLCRGSVLDFSGDCLVNAANEGGLGGGGVDGAINAAGGAVLKRAREMLPEVSPGVRIATGSAAVTTAGAGSLKVGHVIHAVGPDFNSNSHLMSAAAQRLDHPTMSR